jgi:hypothetical protein
MMPVSLHTMFVGCLAEFAVLENEHALKSTQEDSLKMCVLHEWLVIYAS